MKKSKKLQQIACDGRSLHVMSKCLIITAFIVVVLMYLGMVISPLLFEECPFFSVQPNSNPVQRKEKPQTIVINNHYYVRPGAGANVSPGAKPDSICELGNSCPFKNDSEIKKISIEELASTVEKIQKKEEVNEKI